MKRKLIIGLGVLLIMAVGYITALNKNNEAQKIMSSLINMEALANGEEDEWGGDIGSGESGSGTDFCYSREATMSIDTQKCNLGDGVIRHPMGVITHVWECTTGGQGVCLKGNVYKYYDCLGVWLSTCDTRRMGPCK